MVNCFPKLQIIIKTQTSECICYLQCYMARGGCSSTLKKKGKKIGKQFYGNDLWQRLQRVLAWCTPFAQLTKLDMYHFVVDITPPSISPSWFPWSLLCLPKKTLDGPFVHVTLFPGWWSYACNTIRPDQNQAWSSQLSDLDSSRVNHPMGNSVMYFLSPMPLWLDHLTILISSFLRYSPSTHLFYSTGAVHISTSGPLCSKNG